MSQYDLKFDLKTKQVKLTSISWVSDFVFFLEEYFMYKHHTFQLLVSMTESLTSK